ncbi:MAG: hypothetical protein ACR2RV_23145, partial [Verrucomicrobiales bacterium]
MPDSQRRKPQRPLGFAKTTALGALLIVAPVGIIGFSIWQVTKLVKGLLGPIFGTLPFDSTTIRVLILIGALLLVVLICYFTGALVRTRWGKRLRGWAE